MTKAGRKPGKDIREAQKDQLSYASVGGSVETRGKIKGED